MVTKVHEAFNAGQFLTASLSHFSVTHADLDTSATDAAEAAAKKKLVETVGTRATVVLLGAIVDGTNAGTIRVGVENNGAWDATTLAAALGSGWTVAEFVY